MEAVLSAARVTISLAFLTYASWSDFRTREVSNSVWAVFAPMAFLLTFAQLLLYPSMGNVLQSMISYGASFSITSVFSIVLFYAGAFGGADAKALMCIALAFPPESAFMKPLTDLVFAQLHFSIPLSGYVLFPPITIFSNGVIIAASSVLYALVRNFVWKQKTGQKFFEGYQNASFGRKLVTLLCGYKVKATDLKKSFLYPLEDVQATQSGETERLLLLFPKDESREEIVERLATAEGEGTLQGKVWATPGLPMLIFITVGLVVALTLGDVVWLLISHIL